MDFVSARLRLELGFAAAEAYLRGLERRLSAELSLNVHSVAAMGSTISLVGAEARAKSKR
jgi:hypothetical protein